MNVIKLSALCGRLICNDKERRSIKGINSFPVSTSGTIMTDTFIKNVVSW